MQEYCFPGPFPNTHMKQNILCPYLQRQKEGTDSLLGVRGAIL